MSYILDALRKAERDRNLGRPPSLGDVTAAPAASTARGPTPRTLALIALVLALLIATILLWPRHPAAPEPPVAPPVAAAPTPAPSAPAAAPVPQPEAEPEVAAPDAAEMLASDVPAESIDDLMDEPLAPADEEPAPAPEVATPAAPVHEAPLAPEDVETVPFESLPSPPAPSVAEVPGFVEEPPVESDVPLLRDMPSDYRGAFPALRVDVHVYNDDPARRWVMVNGRKAVEGATLSEGPTVSHITPDGIVFDFRGSSTLFPLNR